MVIVNIDSSQLVKLTRAVAHIERGVPRVLVPAINRALSSGRTTVKREIRKHYLIKPSDIPMKVRQANSTTLGGAIELRQGMMDLGKFKVSPRSRTKRRRVIRAQVKVGGGGLLPHAFNTPLAYPGPFERVGKSRLPIRKLITIGAPIMASQPSVGPAVNKAMGDTLAKRIDHEIKRVLASAATSGGA